MKAWICAGVAAALVAGCGSDKDRTENTDFARQTVGGIVSLLPLPGKAARTAQAAAAAPGTDKILRDALAMNKGPLIYAVIETHKTSSILGMIGENGAMRTYATPEAQAIILRDGVLAGTRGLGFDLTSAETDGVAALIRSRTAGTAPKVQRYLDGVGRERPLPLTCTVRTGPASTYQFADQDWHGQQVIEHCEGSGAVIDNSYVVSKDGHVLASRQWIAPELGYVTIQTLRP